MQKAVWFLYYLGGFSEGCADFTQVGELLTTAYMKGAC